MISVIMSVYNETAEEIRASVESLLCQTYQDFEIIIVNDNPQNKDLAQLLEEIGGYDDRIRIYQNEINVGLALSMNVAAKMAKGDVLVRMDADDIAMSQRLEKEYENLKNGGFDCVCSNFSLIDENSDDIHAGQAAMTYRAGNNIALDIFTRGIIHHPTVMMTREIFDKVCGYRNFPCSQDRDLWLRFIDVGCKFLYLDDILLKYRIREQSISKQKAILQQLTIEYINKLFIQRIIRKGTDDYSLDNYHAFLRGRGYQNSNKIKKMEKSSGLLGYAKKYKQQGRPVAAMICRMCAFATNSINRNIWLQRNICKGLVKRHIMRSYKEKQELEK